MPNYIQHVGTSEAAVPFVNGTITPAAAGNRLVAVAGQIASPTPAAFPFTISCTPDLGLWAERYVNDQIALYQTAFQVWDNVALNNTEAHTVTVTKNPGAGGTNINMLLWLWELNPSDFVIAHDAIVLDQRLAVPHAIPAFGSTGLTQHIAAIIARNNRDWQNLEDPVPWNRRDTTAGNNVFRRWAFHDYLGSFITATQAEIDSLIQHDSQSVVVLYSEGAPAPGPTQDTSIDPPDQEEGQVWGYDLAQHFTSSGGPLVFSNLAGAPTGVTLVGQGLACDGTTPAADYQDMEVDCSDDNGTITSLPFGFTITPPAVGTVTTEPLKDGKGNLLTGLSDGVVTLFEDTAASPVIATIENVDQLPNGRITVQDPALTSGQQVFLDIRFPGTPGKVRGSGYYQVT